VHQQVSLLHILLLLLFSVFLFAKRAGNEAKKEKTGTAGCERQEHCRKSHCRKSIVHIKAAHTALYCLDLLVPIHASFSFVYCHPQALLIATTVAPVPFGLMYASKTTCHTSENP
jgi:hypothetical protein